MMKAIFKKHQYGTQSTIGTSEHLKNPSMEKIHAYFNEQYVPNNMAIILSGDIDPDHTIALIENTLDIINLRRFQNLTLQKKNRLLIQRLLTFGKFFRMGRYWFWVARG